MTDPSLIFADLPTLETPRLRLRKMRLDDAEAHFAYASDPLVAEHTGWYPYQSVEASRDFLKVMVDRYAAGQEAGWAIALKEDDRLVGTAGFFSWSVPHRRAEVGYSLARWLWNRGLMTEALRAMIDFGFDRMNLNRIEARCKVENAASARVMEKAGMTFEGVLREHQLAKGAFETMKLYSVLRREWPG